MAQPDELPNERPPAYSRHTPIFSQTFLVFFLVFISSILVSYSSSQEQFLTSNIFNIKTDYLLNSACVDSSNSYLCVAFPPPDCTSDYCVAWIYARVFFLPCYGLFWYSLV